MATSTTDVLIIGAGPTGLTMANLLARGGVKVRILDKKAGPSQETRAVVVHAKILEQLDKLDLADKAIENGEAFSSAQLVSQGKRARTLFLRNNETEKDTPYPFALIHGQDQTEHLLLQSLAEAGGQVEWNTKLLSLEQIADGVQARVHATDGNEETIEAQWVVGADGLHSPVRQALSLGFVGQNYAQTLFIADVDVEQNMESHQGSMELAGQGFFLFVPVHRERGYRLFGTLPPELADRQNLTLDEVQNILDTQSGTRVHILQAHWISVYRTHLRIAERFRVGRVFLAGDAAHIHSPAGGQGMNTGIGDAYNLAWKLALVIKGRAQEKLLDSYEAERMAFARSILRGSDLGFQVMTATNPILRWFKLHVFSSLMSRLSSSRLFRRRFFWLLSQLWTSYRHSPAVAGSGRKGPKPGDRAPYGFFEAGTEAGKSTFALFKGIDHHLLLFMGDKPVSATPEPEASLVSLLSRYQVPVHLHIVSAENMNLHKLYGADEQTLFLVRPDGHLAYRGRAADLDSFKVYLDTFFTYQASQEQTAIQGANPALVRASELSSSVMNGNSLIDQS